MNQRKRVPVFVGVALASLIVVIAWPAREKVQNALPGFARVESSRPSTELSEDEQLLNDIAAQRERSASLTWGRDPFQGPDSKATAAPAVSGPEPTRDAGLNADQLQLSGLSSIGENRMAIIGREIVRRGDQLSSGYTVAQISDGNVTLTRGEEILVLSLGKDR